jgi:hypothetical protein
VADDPRLRCPPYGALFHRALCRSVRPQRISAFRLRRTPRNRSPALPFLTIIRGCGAARSPSYDCHA